MHFSLAVIAVNGQDINWDARVMKEHAILQVGFNMIQVASPIAHLLATVEYLDSIQLLCKSTTTSLELPKVLRLARTRTCLAAVFSKVTAGLPVVVPNRFRLKRL